jgi:hypothetical protein
MGKTVGEGACAVCGHAGEYRQQDRAKKPPRLYFNCAHVADGGCQTQILSRSEKGDQQLARNITKWRDEDWREQLGFRPGKGHNGGPPLEDEPEPPAEPEPEPEPKRKSWLDMEI